MDELADGALLMYPDLDEFFAFPCDVEAVIARDGAVHGHMVERLAADWRLADVVSLSSKSPPLSAQYPLRCRVTGDHFEANHFKQMLTPLVDANGLAVRSLFRRPKKKRTPGPARERRSRYRSSHNVFCANRKTKDRKAKHCAPMGNVSYSATRAEIVGPLDVLSKRHQHRPTRRQRCSQTRAPWETQVPVFALSVHAPGLRARQGQARGLRARPAPRRRLVQRDRGSLARR